MQRFALPLLLLITAIGGFIMADRTNETTLESIEVPNSSPITPVLSARRVPDYLRGPTAINELTSGLDDVDFQSPELTCIAVNDADGNELYAQNTDVALVPASTMKLITGTAALLELGPDYTYTTFVGSTADVVDGVLQGDLYLVGGGDPLLTTQSYHNAFPEAFPHTNVEELADFLVNELGITTLQGGVVGVEGTRYGEFPERYASDWPDRFAAQAIVGPQSALMINDGMASWPEQIEPLLGFIPSPSNDPVVSAAALFDDLLEARGVIVNGGQRSEPEPPLELSVLHSIESIPMSDIVAEMLTFSDNTTAEMVLKEIAFNVTGDGTRLTGTLELNRILTAAGMNASQLFAIDGSGLAAGNRLNCRLVMEVLEFWGLDSAFGDGLADAGESGTLSLRYQGSDVQGRLHAKTGTLNEATALSGFIETTPGEVLTFTYIANPAPGTEFVQEEFDNLVGLQNPLAETLVQYPIGPSLDELGPIAVPGQASPGESGETTDDAETEDPESEDSEPEDPEAGDTEADG